MAASVARTTSFSPSNCVFQHEIKCMMYSFGDCRYPSSESAALIEEITHQQIKELIIRAAEVTNMRGARLMGIEDVLFLLRKDKDKLRRLIRHLNFKEMAKKVSRSEEEEEPQPADYDGFHQPLTIGYKRRRITIDFLSSIDQTGDSSIFGLDEADQMQQERLEHQDAFTKNMDTTQYMEYTECRQANFSKNTAKFKEWLDIASLVELKSNQDIIEVIGFLAYETVGELVELSLLVKKDMESASLASHHLNIPPTTASQFGTTSTFITTPIPNDTGGSLPATPISSSPSQTGTELHGAASPSSINAGSRTSMGKKRKHKGTGIWTDPPEIPLSSIQPVHIREALRRYNTRLGPLVPLSTHFSRPTFTQRTLCV